MSRPLSPRFCNCLSQQTDLFAPTVPTSRERRRRKQIRVSLFMFGTITRLPSLTRLPGLTRLTSLPRLSSSRSLAYPHRARALLTGHAVSIYPKFLCWFNCPPPRFISRRDTESAELLNKRICSLTPFPRRRPLGLSKSCLRFCFRQAFQAFSVLSPPRVTFN